MVNGQRMNIPDDIQEEWNDHLSEWKIALGSPKFIEKAAYNLLELSSTLSSYALGLALEENPPIGLPGFFSDYIKAYMFASFVLDDYLFDEDKKKLFLDFLRRELEESKKDFQMVFDLHTKRYKDR